MIDSQANHDSPSIEREIELDASVEEVWAAMCEPDTWLADEGSLDIAVGGTGRLVDDGIVRHAVVEAVETGRRLVYRWWSDDDEGDAASRVELTLVPSDGPTRLLVRETRVVAQSPEELAALRVTTGPTDRAAATAGLRWEVRFACLALRQDARVGALRG